MSKKVKKVVLAYSGGLDTSVIVRWLIETYDCEVICFAADVLKNITKLNEQAEESERINLRFAINIGEVKVDENGDRLGAAVSMTFRVEGVKPENLIPAEGGMTQEEMPRNNRILVTEHVMKEIQGETGFQTRLTGFFELKGITGLHRIYLLTKTT